MLDAICQVETCQFNIRAFEPGDAISFYALVQRNRERLSLYFPISMNYLTNIYRTRKYVQNKINQARLRNQMAYLLECRDTGRLIGFLIAKNFDWKKLDCELAYWIDRDYQGQGITTMSIQTLVEYALEEWGMERIYLRIDGVNKGSRRVAQKSGFFLDYIAEKEFDRGDGVKIDVEYWVIRK